jgi:hypothetical protein
VPKVDREEFINAGVILSCPELSFLEASIKLNESRLLALDPNVDLDLVKDHLAAIPKICRGGEEAGAIGRLPQRQRFYWLVSPSSTMIQTSPVHTGRCHDAAAALQRLVETMVDAD